MSGDEAKGVFGWEGDPGRFDGGDAAIVRLVRQAAPVEPVKATPKGEGKKRKEGKHKDGAAPGADGGGAGEDGAEPPGPGAPGPSALEGAGPCPVVPLGHADGMFWFLSPSGQVRGITDAKLNANGIRGLFEGRIPWLWDAFPRFDKSGETRVGWGAAQAQEYLIKGAAAQGLFSAEACLRGDGVWPDEAGGLIVHCGDAVLVNALDGGGTWERPGRLGRWVYPARPAMPRPAAEPLSDAEAARLLELVKTWNWARPEIDPLLLLGWIGCGVVCGALRWRPHLWLTGNKAGGKSWLHDLLRALLGGSLESYANTTAAGIRDTLQGGARPVAIDELEADETNDKANALIELARIASQMGGSRGVRGSPGGDARHFEINSVFVFSSILMPPMLPQDISRVTQLDLRPMKATPLESAGVRKRIEEAAALGPALRRRVIDGWARWEETLEVYATALAEAGHENRASSQLGTLLAMADVLLHDGVPERPAVDALVEQLDAAAMAGQADEMDDHLRCLNHLLTSDLDVYRHGERRIVAEEIRLVLMDEPGIGGEESHRRLRHTGLALVPSADQRFGYLAISNTHNGVQRIFAGSHWQARAGRRGAWSQALKRLEGAVVSPNPIAFGGWKSRALLIPVEQLDIEMPKKKVAGSAPRGGDGDAL